MYRNTQPILYVNLLFDDGGAGDCIARLPAVKFIYNNHPHVKAFLWVPDFFYDFARSCLKGTESRIVVGKWSDGPTKYKPGYPARSFAKNNYQNLAVHMTEHAFQIICNTMPDNKNDFNYLKPDLSSTDITKFNLPENYVVISTGFTAKVRQFLPQYINEVVTHVKSKGYTPVFLGKREVPSGLTHVIKGDFNNTIDYSAGIDLIDKTNLFEATKVCANAKCVVGLDNGILHLAACTETKIVGGFTTVKPIHRMPYRNGVLGYDFYPVVPPESLACRFCQSNWMFTTKHPFTECYYTTGTEEPIQCVTQLTAALYIEQLNKIL